MSALDGIATFFLSIVGMVLAVWDIHRKPQSRPEFDEDLVDNMVSVLKEDHNQNRLNGILKDYEVCQADNQRRDNITLLIGSIFTTASLLVIANTILREGQNPMFPQALVSIGVFSLWLFVIHYSSKELDEITYYRIHTIEEALSRHFGYGFGIHTAIFNETSRKVQNVRRPVWWLRRRRMFWDLVLFLVGFTWMLLSLIALHTK